MREREREPELNSGLSFPKPSAVFCIASPEVGPKVKLRVATSVTVSYDGGGQAADVIPSE